MSDAVLILTFVAAATVSLATSWLLVIRLERIGARLGLSEPLLGLLAALAADAPEITAAVTALVGHHAAIGAGVAIGSNVFNLAALLGLSSIIAGRIDLHRRVILLQGTVAVAIAALGVAVVTGALPVVGGLAASLAVIVPFVALLGMGRERLSRIGLPTGWVRWLTEAIHEEEIELEEAIHPRLGRGRRCPRGIGRGGDSCGGQCGDGARSVHVRVPPRSAADRDRSAGAGRDH